MENTETVNIQGSIKVLEVNEIVHLPKSLCVLSSVRAIAAAITADTGKKFNVSGTDPVDIIVTRIS